MDAVVSILAFFQPEKLRHCIIAENIKKIAEHVKYDYGDRLIPFLESRKLILFNMLYANRSAHLDMDYTAYRGLGARSKFKNLLQNLILIAIYLYSSFVKKQCCCRNTGNRVLHPG